MENLASIQEIPRQGHILVVKIMNCNIHEVPTGCVLFRISDQTVNTVNHNRERSLVNSENSVSRSRLEVMLKDCSVFVKDSMCTLQD